MRRKMASRMQIDVFTLFPEWFDWMRHPRHLVNSELELRVFNYRDYTPLSGGQVDDTPYGGGPGMVLRADVVAWALEAVYAVVGTAVRDRRPVIVMSPRGRPLTDRVVRDLAESSAITLLCGRYEGFDERVHTMLASDVICTGPYVLAGGEIPAMTIIDAVGRRLPGALGNQASLDDESFSPSLKGGTEYPHYTRPAQFAGQGVPEVLLSGDHGAIARWRADHVGAAPGLGS
jgi:tRNA (guanine37-N1)-methyltransferase